MVVGETVVTGAVDAASGMPGSSSAGTGAPSPLRGRLNLHFAALAAACAAAGAGTVEKAEASVVSSGPVNINIPSTTAGVYLNVVTGISNISPDLVPGWDLDPWSASGLGLFSPTAPTGGIYVTTVAGGTQVINLPNGTPVGPASQFGTNNSAAANAAVFNFNSTNNLVGFRFQNEANGNAIHYGWMRISFSASSFSQPRAIVEYAYESQAGVAIMAGTLSPPLGVCCRGSTCNASVLVASCTGSGTAGASYALVATTCNPVGNATQPCCYADYNKANGVNVQDIFDYLGGWFGGSAYAKVGGDGVAGVLAVQDIFNFLSAWFAGGC